CDQERDLMLRHEFREHGRRPSAILCWCIPFCSHTVAGSELARVTVKKRVRGSFSIIIDKEMICSEILRHENRCAFVICDQKPRLKDPPFVLASVAERPLGPSVHQEETNRSIPRKIVNHSLEGYLNIVHTCDHSSGWVRRRRREQDLGNGSSCTYGDAIDDSFAMVSMPDRRPSFGALLLFLL